MIGDLERKERSLLGSLLRDFEAFEAQEPKQIKWLLGQAPESFYDLRNAAVAVAIRELWAEGRPVYAGAIQERLANHKDIEAFYVESLTGDALPLSIVEHEAGDIREAYRARRTRSVADEIQKSLESAPDKIDTIIHAAITTLESLNGKSERPAFTLRKPDEFLSMTFDDSDKIIGDRLFASGQSLVIAAAGGTGKSRLILQIAACVIAGRKCLAFETGGQNLRWLILQTENSNRRLKEDLARLRDWLGDGWAAFNERVTIHTIENDSDSFVSLENPENVSNIARAIERTKPDIIAIDPLNDFAIGDLNKDADMKLTLQTLSRVCRKGNPLRGLIPLHHAITGRTGAAKATGYDRSSFARNSKALHSWARGQINLAPVDPDSNDRLIVACGKCSNGREFSPFGIRLNLESMIYECDPSIDVKEWEQTIASTGNGPLMNPERVSELCRGPMTKAELSKVIIEDCGCYRGSAYRYITRAQKSGKLNYNKKLETYTAK